jgi:tetratricopeptide (TPR) repeat protein
LRRQLIFFDMFDAVLPRGVTAEYMGRIEKTVFLSYRRNNAAWALAIVQDLTRHRYDVFSDFNRIRGGDFETVILDNIKARAHFIVLLTPSALKRCSEPGDWLRREVETALKLKRNIVPLMLEGFKFNTPSIAGQLTGKMQALKKYNALWVPAEFFGAAMKKLREEYLNVALDAVPHPATHIARQAARAEQAAVKAAPAVKLKELTAQQWFEKAFKATKISDELHYYNKALRLKPDYSSAFVNRGNARKERGDLRGALEDYNAAIRFEPGDAESFYNRALLREEMKDLKGALRDYDKAIRLQPDEADFFYNRALAREAKKDIAGALQDYDRAISLRPKDADAFNARGSAREAKGDVTGALKDYSHALRLQPDYSIVYYNRALLRQEKGDVAAALADFEQYLRYKGRSRNGDSKGVKQMIRNLKKKL